MTPVPEIQTDRLLMRGWREADLEPFAAMNADPVVMRFLQGTRSSERSDADVLRIVDTWRQRGFGLWAVEVPGALGFIGFVGLAPAEFEAPFTPAIEVGYRLARHAWGRGYATEGARAACNWGFRIAGLPDILSFTARINLPSRAVLERVGMRRDVKGDFDHPWVPLGHPVRPHVLYGLTDDARAAYGAPRV